MSDPVLFAYSLDGWGGDAALHDGAISRLLKDDQLAWAHLNADHPDTAAWLRREVGYLDDFVVMLCLLMKRGRVFCRLVRAFVNPARGESE